MGALDSSRKGTDAPFDAFLTRNLLSRSARVAAERLLTCNESWTPSDSAYYDDTDTDYREVRLTGKHHQYGLPMFVEADPEFHDLRVAYIITPKYEDMEVRFYAYGIDGRFHRLQHVGATSGTTNLTTITATNVMAVYNWTLSLDPIRNLGNTRFVLFMTVDSEISGSANFYGLWAFNILGVTPARGRSTPHSLKLVENTIYPVTESSTYFKAFSNDYGDQPVRLTLLRRRIDAAGLEIFEPLTTTEPDLLVEPTNVAGLCVGAALPGGPYYPDVVWIEPPIHLELQNDAQIERMFTGSSSTAVAHHFYSDYRVIARGMGELIISGMAFAGQNEVYTDASGDELMEVGFSMSKVPSWNVSQWYSALQANRTPRAWTTNRLLYSLPTDLWAERTPIEAWGSDELFTHLINVDSALTFYTLFQEPLGKSNLDNNAFYEQGDASVKLRKHMNIMFTWAYFENGTNIEDHLYNVQVTFYDVSGASLSTETFEGAMEMSNQSENAGSVRENAVDGMASGNGRGFFFRRLNPGAGRYGENALYDWGLASKNWPSSDKPHRFWRVCPLNAFKYLAPQTFQVDIEVPAGATLLEVAVRPNVSQAFYDDIPGNREGNIILLHRRVRMTQGAGWDVIGL